MENIEEIIKRVKKLDELYEKTHDKDLEEEMIELYKTLSFEDIIKIENILTD